VANKVAQLLTSHVDLKHAVANLSFSLLVALAGCELLLAGDGKYVNVVK
jgi:hypothetical protein